MQRIFMILSSLSILATLLTGCAVTAAPSLAAVAARPPAEGEVLTFDMAEDFTRFVFDPSIVSEEGYPVHGSTFITQGYLYPAGTLDGAPGVNADGSPQFPDKVIGTWICRGWVLGDTTGSDGKPSAISTQFFHLDEGDGSRTIITEGYEFMQPDGPFRRAITGGSGEYRHATGEQVQELLGVNEYMGLALRFELHLER